MYLESLVSQEKQVLENGSDKDKSASNPSNAIGISSMQSKVDAVSSDSSHEKEQIAINDEQENDKQTPGKGDKGVNDNVQVPNPGLNNPSSIDSVSAPGQVAKGGVNNNVQVPNPGNNDPSLPSNACGFNMEKPKLPKFAGDVREYAIFKADFKHAVEARYTKRDANTLLRTCLQGKPLDLIKEIGTDYDAA